MSLYQLQLRRLKNQPNKIRTNDLREKSHIYRPGRSNDRREKNKENAQGYQNK